MSGPITIVTPGSNVNSATGTDILLNSSIPFTKLDTTNIVSFQTISLLFNNEPTQPPTSAPYYSNTLVYQFPHGYNYIPSIWMMWQNPSPAFPGDNPGAGGSLTSFYPFGDDTEGVYALGYMQSNIQVNLGTLAYLYYGFNSGAALATTADLYATVDETNVYIYVLKSAITWVTGDSSIPLYLAGTTLNLRCYVFTEPASTSTY